MSSLINVVNGVSKEVYLRCFEMSASDLQEIVKNSYKAERLIFRHSDIDCADELDFNIQSKYNLKFLSFDRCGDLNCKSGFRSNAASFENIVKAIENSGLHKSLETVDAACFCLRKETIEEMFNIA